MRASATLEGSDSTRATRVQLLPCPKQLLSSTCLACCGPGDKVSNLARQTLLSYAAYVIINLQ
jgi:hypothetical protein